MSELKAKRVGSEPRQSPAQHDQSSIATPCPIRFARAICGDIRQAERREWWIANGLGGYASGTIAGSLTRRYHGLLIAPVASPLGRRLILAKADATLIEGPHSWPCSRTDGRAVTPFRPVMFGLAAFISTTPFPHGPTKSAIAK